MENLKVIALYLPQFHRVLENDLWWGEGFTDWDAVKRAQSLFSGHQQPKHPLNDNYYDLMKKDILKWQINLAKKYSIDGFCFYHYWFKGGRQILEKPAENLLKWQEINFPFCFSWANESWIRSWSNLANKNSWAESFEPRQEGFESGVLLEQKYENEEAWRRHFEYLLPFFQDRRYIKIHNKPLFLIHRPELIPCLTRMTNLWRKMAEYAGFDGICFLGMNGECKDMDINMLSMSKYMYALAQKKNGYRYVSYDEVWHAFLQDIVYKDLKNNIYCSVVSYDDTPRRGINGLIMQNSSKEKFRIYYDELVRRSLEQNKQLLFVNAWNEWGEGMYLEPDEINQYGFLEVIHDVQNKYDNLGSLLQKDTIKKEKIDRKLDSVVHSQFEKLTMNYKMMHSWLLLNEGNRSIEEFFLTRNYLNIGIYGFGINGKHLITQLNKSQITIKYIIDKNSRQLNSARNIPIYGINETLPVVDVIIVSVINEFSSIEADLEKVVRCPIISLEEVIYES